MSAICRSNFVTHEIGATALLWQRESHIRPAMAGFRPLEGASRLSR